jgi:2-succinyl-5-enolpyruvyl-6-hydroxy-3-cyclohexene-1-carboxylate synthase
MSRPNPSTAMAEVAIDELARNGVSLVVISPGSRSAALAIAASRHPGIQTVVVLDERSAAFHALGRSKVDGFPAVVISTSGTAPANWYPAVIEADMSMTPLILISADRPAESRGVGANQTIDQVRLFGDKVRWFAEIDAPGQHDMNAGWRGLICEAMIASRGDGSGPGPVHLNLAFREPTVPVPDDGRTATEPYPHAIEGRDGGHPWIEPPPAAPRPSPGREIPYAPRGLVIAGDGSYQRDRLLEAARALGWPVLATALSGLRGQDVITCYHHLLAGTLPDGLRPELVVAAGHIGPSQRLEALIATADHRVRVDAWGRSIDPNRNATLKIDSDPVSALATMADQARPDPDWASAWSKAGAMVRSQLDRCLADHPGLSGAGVAHTLDRVDWGCLVVASSLPIREVDAHLTRPGSIMANRGASGIDGFVSTAMGVASAVPRTLALSGDLSLLHDANGFLNDGNGDLTMVVINNDGGGLFDSLPQAAHAPDYERLFLTPQRRDLAALARFHGLDYQSAEGLDQLAAIVESRLGSGQESLIEAPVDRGFDLAVRRSLDEAGRSAMAGFNP